MKKAYLNLRYTVPMRQQAFTAGLQRLGYEVRMGLCRDPEPGDIMCSWSRIHEADEVARLFSERGCTVLVTENASWGTEFAGKFWYTIAMDYHNEAGRFPLGGPDRWDDLGVRLEPWRTSGETVVLPSRGIGPYVSRMPRGWAARQGGRVRPHPGRGVSIPLEQDLAHAGKVVTWASGAAIKALMWGIPVESHFDRWIGKCESTDEDRLRCLREMAWAQWTIEEIARGDAFERLLTAR